MRYLVLCLIILSLVLAACVAVINPSAGGSPATEVEEGVTVLSGTVQNWTLGTATLEAVASDSQGSPLGTLTTGEIDEEGRFRLELPAELSPELLYTQDSPLFCADGSVKVSPSYQGTEVGVLNVIQDGKMVGMLLPSSSEAFTTLTGLTEGDFRVLWYYADQAVSISGPPCTNEAGFTQDWGDVTLEPGWNTGLVTVTGMNAEGFPTSLHVAIVPEAPNTMNWYFMGGFEE